MKLPSAFALTKLIGSAIANRSKWEEMAAEPVTGTDTTGNISIAFDAKTNRFAGVTLAVATDAERAVATAVIEAANEALARSDARWTHAVREVPGGAEVLASGER